MDEEIDTYEPKIIEQNPLNIDKKDDDFGSGLIKTRLNQDVIIQRIAKDLYKNPSSGLRELYANAVRACKLAKGEKSVITVEVDAQTRRLAIRDNGTGISKARFKKVLLELGTSDNHDGKMTGQFGMGFAAYTTLSSALILETKTRDGDNYKMIAKDGMSFQYLGKTKMMGYGTRLEMICHNDVNLRVVMQDFMDCVRFSGVHTVLFGADTLGSPAMSQEMEFKPQTILEYAERHRGDETVVHIETDAFEFVSLIGPEKSFRSSGKYLLAGVPIRTDIEVPFRWFVFNIKDERKYPPMPDRDRMREESDKALNELFKAALKERFAKLEMRSYGDFLASHRQQEYLWKCFHTDYLELGHDDAMLTTLANTMCKRVGMNCTIDFETERLAYKLMVNPSVRLLRWKNVQAANDSLNRYPEEELIMLHKDSNGYWKDRYARLVDWGIPTTQTSRTKDTILAHQNRGEYETVHVDKTDVDETYIMMDGYSITSFLSFLRNYQSKYRMIKPSTNLKGAVRYTHWIANIAPNITVRTNRGKKTIRDIVDEKIVFVDDYEEWQNGYYDEYKDEVVCLDTGLQFAVLCVKYPTGAVFNFNDTGRYTFAELLDRQFGTKCLISQKTAAFFARNLKKIPRCFHAFFLETLIENHGNERDVLKMMVKIKDKFDWENPLAALTWYNRHLVLARHGDDHNALGTSQSINRLIRRTYENLAQDDTNRRAFIKDMFLPDVVGECKNVRIEPTSMDKYSISWDLGPISLKSNGVSYKMEYKILNTEISDERIKIEVQILD